MLPKRQMMGYLKKLMKLKTYVHAPPLEALAIAEILNLGHTCHTPDDASRILQLLVEKIAITVKADVCSLYLYDNATQQLTLSATHGLNPKAVGCVSMGVGEGLVGKTIEWLKPVSMSWAKKSKQFKYFPETGEEKYASFLSVPLIYNRTPLGVLVIQNIAPMNYSKKMVQLMVTLAVPTVSVIEKIKLLGTFGQIEKRTEEKAREIESAGSGRQNIHHYGIGASPGIGMGSIVVIKKVPPQIVQSHPNASLHADVEKMRILEAFRWVEEELREVQKKAAQKFGMEELSIFDAYQVVLESEPFKNEIVGEIEKGKPAFEAVEAVIARYVEELSKAQDQYLLARIYDIQDVGRKIQNRLLYGSDVPKHLSDLAQNSILSADYWSVSDFVEMDLDHTKGILSSTGGASSHVAILAESLGIPAVLGLASFNELIKPNDFVIMDGCSGHVILNPASGVKEAYEKEFQDYQKAKSRYQAFVNKKAQPKKGKRIIVGANMGMVSHAGNALAEGAEEIGLYRTEFPFLVKKSLPTEEEQFALYQKVVLAMKGKPTTFRTLDIGGDKYLPYLNLPEEENPCLGWRSIRISLERQDLFRIQLRALLRASAFGPVRIMFPMISSVDEVVKIKEIVANVKKELKSGKFAFSSHIPLGIMIEIPAAAELAHHLIREVSFFSIGSNDLTQYTLAVDRNNSRIASLYRPLHPAVIRLIAKTIDAAHKQKKPVGVCGEMASQPLSVLLLLGLGVDSLSMNFSFVSKIKSLICKTNYPELKKISRTALACRSAEEVENLFKNYLVQKGLGEYFSQALK